MERIDHGIAEAAAGGGAGDAVHVAALVAAGGGNEGDIHRHLAGDEGAGPAAVGPDGHRAVEFPPGDELSDEAVHPALQTGYDPLAHVGDELGVDGVDGTGGDPDIPDAEGVDRLHDPVE